MLAASFETQQAFAQSPEQASAKKAVYVRTSSDGIKYTYNKHGLITKTYEKDSKFTRKFKYKGTKLVWAGFGHGSRMEVEYSVKYDSKGRVSKIDITSSGMPNDLYNRTETYKYKKNKVVKVIEKGNISGTKTYKKYKYNSKGLVSKIVFSDGTKDILKYDDKGNKTYWKRTYPKSANRANKLTKYENTYSKDRLSSVDATEGNHTWSYIKKIKYAKKSVPAKYASAVKAQQKQLCTTVPGSLVSLFLAN